MSAIDRHGIRACSVALLLVSSAPIFAGDQPTDAAAPPHEAIEERVTVTATLAPVRLADTPGSLVCLGPDVLASSAAPSVDGVLRQIPGFSLLRRTGSRAANPTAQGVSLRGLGASGASRALVLVDGQPFNDPFGGWVHWARVPRDEIASVELLRGGASALHGDRALGGVVQVLTRPLPERAELRGEASAGSQETFDGSLAASARAGAWGVRLLTSGQRTAGYAPVEERSRGSVDTEVASRHSVVDLRVERAFGPSGRIFARGGVFGESRQNGTPLQVNATHVRDGLIGGDWSSASLGSLRVRLDLANQVFTQSFSSVAADRSRESLTRRQRVPARAAGVSLVVNRSIGRRHHFVLGLDRRHVKGASDEIAYAGGLPTASIDAGGRALTTGVFAEDIFQVSPRLLVAPAVRFDRWDHQGGFTQTRPLTSSALPGAMALPDRSQTSFSPRVSAVFHATPSLSLTAAGYGALRGPTLNELYRSFRLGNTLTLANAELVAERLAGGELGARWRDASGRVSARVTAFSASVRDPVANVTLSTTPQLVTRQRQNLGQIRSRGLEAELEASPAAALHLAAAYAFTDSRVERFPANPALEGLFVTQVPRHQFTFQARYEPRPRLRVAVQGRWTGAQFEDDQNDLRLRPAFQLDAFVARSLRPELEVFVAAENLLGSRAEVGLVSIRTLGSPLAVRAGLRFRLGQS